MGSTYYQQEREPTARPHLYVTQLWADHHFPHCTDEETDARELKNSIHVWGTGSIWELSVLSAQFCKPKTALKNIKNIF